MIAGDSNRPPDTLLRLVDFDVANHVNIVSPSSFTQVSGGTVLIMQLQGIRTEDSLYCTAFKCDFDVSESKDTFSIRPFSC